VLFENDSHKQQALPANHFNFFLVLSPIAAIFISLLPCWKIRSHNFYLPVWAHTDSLGVLPDRFHMARALRFVFFSSKSI